MVNLFKWLFWSSLTAIGVMVAVFIIETSKVFLAVLYHFMKKKYPKSVLTAESSTSNTIDTIIAKITAPEIDIDLQLTSAAVYVSAKQIFNIVVNVFRKKPNPKPIDLTISNATIKIHQKGTGETESEPTELEPKDVKKWPFIAPAIMDYVIGYAIVPLFLFIFGTGSPKKIMPVLDNIHLHFKNLKYLYVEEEEIEKRHKKGTRIRRRWYAGAVTELSTILGSVVKEDDTPKGQPPKPAVVTDDIIPNVKALITLKTAFVKTGIDYVPKAPITRPVITDIDEPSTEANDAEKPDLLVNPEVDLINPTSITKADQKDKLPVITPAISYTEPSVITLHANCIELSAAVLYKPLTDNYKPNDTTNEQTPEEDVVFVAIDFEASALVAALENVKDDGSDEPGPDNEEDNENFDLEELRRRDTIRRLSEPWSEVLEWDSAAGFEAAGIADETFRRNASSGSQGITGALGTESHVTENVIKQNTPSISVQTVRFSLKKIGLKKETYEIDGYDIRVEVHCAIFIPTNPYLIYIAQESAFTNTGANQAGKHRQQINRINQPDRNDSGISQLFNQNIAPSAIVPNPLFPHSDNIVAMKSKATQPLVQYDIGGFPSTIQQIQQSRVLSQAGAQSSRVTTSRNERKDSGLKINLPATDSLKKFFEALGHGRVRGSVVGVDYFSATYTVRKSKKEQSKGESEIAVAIASSPIFAQLRLSDFAKESYPSQKIDIDENQVRKLGLLIATIPATLNLIQLILPTKPQSNIKGAVENLAQSTNPGLVEPNELTQVNSIQHSSLNSNKNASIVEPKNKVSIGAVTIRIQAVAFRVIESDDDQGLTTGTDVTFSATDIAIQREQAPLASILQKSTTDLLTVYPPQSSTTGGKTTEKAEIPLKKKEEQTPKKVEDLAYNTHISAQNILVSIIEKGNESSSMSFDPAEFETLIGHEPLLSIASASLLFFTTESAISDKTPEELGQYKAQLGVKQWTFDAALYGETRIVGERESLEVVLGLANEALNAVEDAYQDGKQIWVKVRKGGAKKEELISEKEDDQVLIKEDKKVNYSEISNNTFTLKTEKVDIEFLKPLSDSDEEEEDEDDEYKQDKDKLDIAPNLKRMSACFASDGLVFTRRSIPIVVNEGSLNLNEIAGNNEEIEGYKVSIHKLISTTLLASGEISLSTISRKRGDQDESNADEIKADDVPPILATTNLQLQSRHIAHDFTARKTGFKSKLSKELQGIVVEAQSGNVRVGLSDARLSFLTLLIDKLRKLTSETEGRKKNVNKAKEEEENLINSILSLLHAPTPSLSSGSAFSAKGFLSRPLTFAFRTQGANFAFYANSPYPALVFSTELLSIRTHKSITKPNQYILSQPTEKTGLSVVTHGAQLRVCGEVIISGQEIAFTSDNKFYPLLSHRNEPDNIATIGVKSDSKTDNYVNALLLPPAPTTLILAHPPSFGGVVSAALPLNANPTSSNQLIIAERAEIQVKWVETHSWTGGASHTEAAAYFDIETLATDQEIEGEERKAKVGTLYDDLIKGAQSAKAKDRTNAMKAQTAKKRKGKRASDDYDPYDPIERNDTILVSVVRTQPFIPNNQTVAALQQGKQNDNEKDQARKDQQRQSLQTQLDILDGEDQTQNEPETKRKKLLLLILPSIADKDTKSEDSDDGSDNYPLTEAVNPNDVDEWVEWESYKQETTLRAVNEERRWTTEEEKERQNERKRKEEEDDEKRRSQIWAVEEKRMDGFRKVLENQRNTDQRAEEALQKEIVETTAQIEALENEDFVVEAISDSQALLEKALQANMVVPPDQLQSVDESQSDDQLVRDGDSNQQSNPIIPNGPTKEELREIRKNKIMGLHNALEDKKTKRIADHQLLIKKEEEVQKEEDSFAVRLRTREAEVEKDKQKGAVRTMERQEEKTQQNKRRIQKEKLQTILKRIGLIISRRQLVTSLAQAVGLQAIHKHWIPNTKYIENEFDLLQEREFGKKQGFAVADKIIAEAVERGILSEWEAKLGKEADQLFGSDSNERDYAELALQRAKAKQLGQFGSSRILGADDSDFEPNGPLDGMKKPNALIGLRNLKVLIPLDLNFESPLQVSIESVKKIFSFWSKDKGKKENKPETENEDENDYNEPFTFAADVQGLTVGVLDTCIASFLTHKSIAHFISTGVRDFQEEEGEGGRVPGAGQLAKCDTGLRRYIQVLDVIRDDSKSSIDGIGAGTKSEDEKLKDEIMKRAKDEKKLQEKQAQRAAAAAKKGSKRATFAGTVPPLKQESSIEKNLDEKLNAQQIRSNKPLPPYELDESAQDYVDDIRAPAAHLVTSATRIPAFLGSNPSYHPRSILFALAVQSLKTHLLIKLNSLDKNLNSQRSFNRSQLVFSGSAEQVQLVSQITTQGHKVFDSEKIEIASILTYNERQFKIDNARLYIEKPLIVASSFDINLYLAIPNWIDDAKQRIIFAVDQITSLQISSHHKHNETSSSSSRTSIQNLFSFSPQFRFAVYLKQITLALPFGASHPILSDRDALDKKYNFNNPFAATIHLDQLIAAFSKEEDQKIIYARTDGLSLTASTKPATSIFDEKDKDNQPIILIRKDKGNEITAENPGVSAFFIPRLTLNSSYDKNNVSLNFNAESLNHNDPVFEISLPILAFFTHLIQDYIVRIKRSPLPVAYKLKREIKLRASQDSEVVENTSYAFGIKFNSLSGVVTSSELLLTGNVFDKLSISGTKDDAEKRALKRAERRREEIVKQNEKRRRLEEAAKKGGLSEEEKRAQRKGVDNTIPSARIVVALPAITVETKVHLEGELVEQTIRILEESPEEIVEVKKPKNQPQVAPKTIEQQLPPIFIESLKIDDLKIEVAEILVLVSDTKTIDRLVSQKKESQQQLITFPASTTNGPEAGTFQEKADKLIPRDLINEKANKFVYQTQYVPLVERYCVWNFTKIEIRQSGEDPELKISAETASLQFTPQSLSTCLTLYQMFSFINESLHRHNLQTNTQELYTGRVKPKSGNISTFKRQPHDKLLQVSVSGVTKIEAVDGLDDESFDPSEEGVVLYLPHWNANLVRLFGAKSSKGEQLDEIVLRLKTFKGQEDDQSVIALDFIEEIDQDEDEIDDDKDDEDEDGNKKRSPTKLIHAATIPGDFSITAVLLCGQTMPKDEVRDTYTVAIDEFQLSIIDDNLDQFIKMAFEDYREAYRAHTHPRNTGRLTRALPLPFSFLPFHVNHILANTPKYRDTKMYDKITGDGQFNKDDFANIDLKSLRYQIFSGIRGRVIGNGSVAQQEMLFAKVCFDTLVAHLEDESGEISQVLEESIVKASTAYDFGVSQYKTSITTVPGASQSSANANETNKPEKPMTSKSIPVAKAIQELFENRSRTDQFFIHHMKLVGFRVLLRPPPKQAGASDGKANESDRPQQINATANKSNTPSNQLTTDQLNDSQLTSRSEASDWLLNQDQDSGLDDTQQQRTGSGSLTAPLFVFVIQIKKAQVIATEASEVRNDKSQQPYVNNLIFKLATAAPEPPAFLFEVEDSKLNETLRKPDILDDPEFYGTIEVEEDLDKYDPDLTFKETPIGEEPPVEEEKKAEKDKEKEKEEDEQREAIRPKAPPRDRKLYVTAIGVESDDLIAYAFTRLYGSLIHNSEWKAEYEKNPEGEETKKEN